MSAVMVTGSVSKGSISDDLGIIRAIREREVCRRNWESSCEEEVSFVLPLVLYTYPNIFRQHIL